VAVKIGIFVVPDATEAEATVEQMAADFRRLGEDVAPRVRELVEP
jgi:hypothetical protein